jgi:para-nitrobenzyl esterase
VDASRTPDAVKSGPGEQAETWTGLVGGYSRGGVFVFKGIPYGATTEGTARFKPALTPTPWQGVRSSRAYGPVCPQGIRGGWKNDAEAFLMRWDDGFPDEDCLRLNIWTTGLSGKKLPVMVWLHGGGFVAGSGHELPAYDGENLARSGEVVVVSVNHRLGPFGHLNLAELGGAEFADSANVGMLDLVLALAWVKNNIGNFGGDAGNVTIFGQSGGGMKVATLMVMPLAQGLFHKAIVQSGSFPLTTTSQESTSLASALLDELKISRTDYKQLLQVPAQLLVQAGERAVARTGPRPEFVGRGGVRIGWTPTIDGRVVTAPPYSAAGAKQSPSIPLLIGCTRDEFGMHMRADPELTEARVLEKLKGGWGDKAKEIYAKSKELFPKENPGGLLSVIAATALRNFDLNFADLKHAANAAPAYSFLFTYVTPSLGGSPGAFHCADLPFCFDNVERCDSSTGNTDAARRLGGVMSRAWINFARTGNPSQTGLAWPPHDPRIVPTMLFDTDSRIHNDPFGALRKLTL